MEEQCINLLRILVLINTNNHITTTINKSKDWAKLKATEIDIDLSKRENYIDGYIRELKEAKVFEEKLTKE